MKQLQATSRALEGAPLPGTVTVTRAEFERLTEAARYLALIVAKAQFAVDNTSTDCGDADYARSILRIINPGPTDRKQQP